MAFYMYKNSMKKPETLLPTLSFTGYYISFLYLLPALKSHKITVIFIYPRFEL